MIMYKKIYKKRFIFNKFFNKKINLKINKIFFFEIFYLNSMNLKYYLFIFIYLLIIINKLNGQ